jgi:hypothetical protein
MYIKATLVSLISGIDRAVLKRARWFGLTTIKLDKVMLFEGQWLPRTGSQLIAITTALGLGLAFVPAAWADPASDACTPLADARNALYSMINAKDKFVQDALNAKVQAASTKLDSVLAGMTGAETKVAAASRQSGISSRRRVRKKSFQRSTRATPPRPRRLLTAFNTSVCPKCGASCPVDDQKE